MLLVTKKDNCTSGFDRECKQTDKQLNIVMRERGGRGQLMRLNRCVSFICSRFSAEAAIDNVRDQKIRVEEEVTFSTELVGSLYQC